MDSSFFRVVRIYSLLWGVLLPSLCFAQEEPFPEAISTVVWAPDVQVLAPDVQVLGQRPLTFGQRIHRITFSADGTQLYVQDNGIGQFDWAKRKFVRRFWHLPKKGESFHFASFSPDRKLYARIFDNQEYVHLHRTDTTELLHTLDGHGGIPRDVAWSSDGATLALSAEGKISLWDVASGKQTRLLPQGWLAVFSADGKRLAAGAGNGKGILVYQLDQITPPMMLNDDATHPSVLRFSPDGKTLTSASNYRIKHFDLESGKRTNMHLIKGENFAALSPNGKMAAAGGLTRLRVIDTQTGEELLWNKGEPINHHWVAAAFSPDNLIFAAALRNRIKLWDTRTWERIDVPKGHDDVLSGAEFSRDGKYLVTSDFLGRLVMWDWEKKSIRWKMDPPARNWGIKGISISPDRKLIGITMPPSGNPKGHRYHLIDFETGLPVSSFGGNQYTSNNILFSAQAPRAYVGLPGARIAEIELPSGRQLRTIGGDHSEAKSATRETSVMSLAFPPDSEETIWWLTRMRGLGQRRLSDGVDTRHAFGGGGDRIQVSPNNDWVTMDGAIWDRERSAFVSLKPSNQVPRKCTASYPFGRLVAASAGSKVEMIDLLTWRVVQTFEFGPGDVNALAFSPDGSTLVAVGEGGIRYASVVQQDPFLAIEGASSFVPQYFEPDAKPGRLWEVMGKVDAEAYQASWQLAEHSDFRAFVGEMLDPAQAPTKELTEHLRMMLRDASPDVRVTSARMLNDMGVELGKEDRLALIKSEPHSGYGYFGLLGGDRPTSLQSFKLNPPVEVNLSEVFNRPIPIPTLHPLSNRLRSSRAILLLEKDGSPWAVEILEVLAKGYEKSPQTREAKWALRRLHGR